MAFFFLVSIVQIVQAQETKCNSAWEETVNSITDNKACIEELYLGGYNIEPPFLTKIKVDSNSVNISYDHSFETLKYDYVWKMRNVGDFHIPLLNLQEAFVKNENLFLKLVDESAIHSNKQYLWSPSGSGYLYPLNSGTKKTDFIAFSISDSAVTFQLLQAFQQLSCLAGEKRKYE